MQLRYIGLMVACTLASSAVAQSPATSAPARRVRKLEDTEVNILGSYYSQDGDHSPVTGGVGTEQLTDVSPVVIVNVPLDTVTNLNVHFGMDFYSSASTDNIDFNVSSASKSDLRTHLNVGISRRNSLSRVTKSLTLGASTEYDYQSFSLGATWAKESRDGNREFSLGGMAFFDTWKLIYPQELRGNGELVNTDKRQSYTLSATLSQVLTQKMQASLSADIVYQSGLLSTPFHRVYFREQELPRVEQLPDQRLKYPVGLRVNYYVNDYLTTRFFYRFYSDNWGVTANTVEVETPIKFGPFFSFYPFYRFHNQSAADYFAPFQEHSLSQELYTSDYDLSGLSSHKAGLGIRYSPLTGIGNVGLPFSKNRAHLKGIEVRLANYWRSDGLRAFIISTDLNFTLPGR
ncbi:DUF3570 domain-containing protein [Pontibacter chinhatensis]|nr:DUF3570 domain-containing protein [Pontibacter chinhatensis]